ncbi:hypothetical protein BSPWISOXPB_1744 [uncultured Gammaproteobacteria bacterium]|nr:hypothetical protein BSPWISOXPB_1744 [uncultured Gammaproteobacteria bacterium]
MKNYSDFFTIKRLWIALIVSLILSFSALLYLGGQIYQQAPPIPNAVQIVNGNVIYSKQDIEDGQNIWQTIGVCNKVQFGVMVAIWHLIGAQIGYIERPYLC